MVTAATNKATNAMEGANEDVSKGVCIVPASRLCLPPESRHGALAYERNLPANAPGTGWARLPTAFLIRRSTVEYNGAFQDVKQDEEAIVLASSAGSTPKALTPETETTKRHRRLFAERDTKISSRLPLFSFMRMKMQCFYGGSN